MCGVRAAWTGEQSIGTLCFSLTVDSIPEKTVCDAVLSECESTRPLIHGCKSVPGANSHQDLLSVNMLNGRFPSALLMGPRCRIGQSPPSLLGTPNSGWTKQPSRLLVETCSIAPSPSSCIALIHMPHIPILMYRIRAFRASVRDYAMPLKRGGLRLN